MGFLLYGTMGRDGHWDCKSIMGHVDVPWDSMGQWDGMDTGTASPSWDMWTSHGIPWDNGTGWTLGLQVHHGTMGRDGHWGCKSIMGRVDVLWDSLCPMGQWDGMDTGTGWTLGRDGHWDCKSIMGHVDIPWDPLCPGTAHMVP